MANSSWLWLAPKPATGSAMVLSATFRTVLSSTIAIRLVIRTPRMIHRRRYTFRSVSASGATAEASARGETPGCSMRSLPGPRPGGDVVPRPVHPGTAGGPSREGHQYGTGPYRNKFPRGRVAPPQTPPAGRRQGRRPAGLSPARGAWHPEVVRGRHRGATRQEEFP